MAGVATDLSMVYLRIAEECQNEAKKSKDKAINADARERGDYIEEERKKSLFAILFSVLALEAYINYFCLNNFEKEKCERIMRTSTLVKWLLLPKAVLRPSFNFGTNVFANFKTIIRYRNKLVHYELFDPEEPVKHPSGTFVTPLYKITNSDNANLAYTTAKNMIDKLKELEANMK